MPESAKSRLRQLFWRSLVPQYTLRSGLHVKISSYSDWYIYNEIFVDEDYDCAIEMLLCKTGNQPLCVLDLGANVGFFTLRLVEKLRVSSPSRRFRIIAVEGNPVTAKVLQERIEANGLALDVRVVHGLVGKKSGEGVISSLEFSVQNTVNDTSENGSRVSYIDLTQLTEEFERIDLIKCDIEGSELSFAESYPDILDKTEAAIFEFHPNLCNTDRCAHLLAEAGFNQSALRMQKDAVQLMHFWKSSANILLTIWMAPSPIVAKKNFPSQQVCYRIIEMCWRTRHLII